MSELIKLEMLKDLLCYCPERGIFTWRESTNTKIKVGSVAGHEKATGYNEIRINGKTYKAHRLAWLYVYGEWPKGEIDHINHDGMDNRISNLRDVSHRENGMNQPIRKNNKSGVNGIHKNKSGKKWLAAIHTNYKVIPLGSFSDKFEAICARKSAENKYKFHANHGR